MPSTKFIASTPSTSPIKRALFLSVFLFTVFLIATGLYARYGYAFALRVYEQQQLANVERRTGSGKLVEYEDYLRVDPTNLYMRGLLINQFIEFKNPWRALEVALEGVAAVPPDQRPIAKLLVGRAQIARGKLDEAEATYNEVLETLGESGEAHYGFAHIAAGRGNFEKMQKEFDAIEHINTLVSSPDFVHGTSDVKSYANTDDAYTISFVLSRIQKGWIESISLLSGYEDFRGAPPIALFYRGVYEEEQGNRDAALDFYRRAAEAGDALGKFAAERLGSQSDSSEE